MLRGVFEQELQSPLPTEIESAVPLLQFGRKVPDMVTQYYCMYTYSYVSINETSVRGSSTTISFSVNNGISEYGEIQEGLFQLQ